MLQSLLHRAKAGEGRAVEVSLFHTMADWMNVPYLQTRYGGTAPARVGLRHPSIAPYGAFRCADDRQVLLSVQNDREWTAFSAEILQQPDLATDPRFATNVARVARMAEIEALIAPVFAAIDREAAVAQLSKAGIACGPMSTMEDMEHHPQAHHITLISPTGPIEMMGRGVRFSDATVTGRDVPALGAQTASLWTEFGGKSQGVSG
ncbi:CoA transferase [Pseudotabrizicola sp. 4114]|uniref:CoA transferase n=1 Tax=Pseudotabrizicola sp. 4114 TaxID=2817731 RepID=UPI00286622B5|nr:crotonobetainyl-CoA:carnitine CoA-transferase CaiB-like acyl-CoA transferase [Pseudorhodobacter sp. 4114]